VIHYYWGVKSDIRMPVLYGVILAALLLYRGVKGAVARYRMLQR
jgi:DMSO/TMAO reductase YedYZ heme-binding membrane subunit